MRSVLQPRHLLRRRLVLPPLIGDQQQVARQRRTRRGVQDRAQIEAVVERLSTARQVTELPGRLQRSDVRLLLLRAVVLGVGAQRGHPRRRLVECEENGHGSILIHACDSCQEGRTM